MRGCMERAVFLRDFSNESLESESAFDFSACPWSIKDALFAYVYSIALFLALFFWLAVGYSLFRLIAPQQFVSFFVSQMEALKYFYIIFVFYASLFLIIRSNILKKYHIKNLMFFIRKDKVLSDIFYGAKSYLKFFVIMTTGIIMIILIMTMWDMVFSSGVRGKLDVFFNAAQLEKRVVVSHAHGVFGAIILLILAPFFEELYFRGCLYRALRARYAKGTAIVVSSFIFSLLHGYFFIFIYVFFIGIILACIYDKRRSLVAPLTFHMINNLAVILFFL